MNANELTDILQIQTYTGQQFRMFSYLVRQIKNIPGCRLHSKNGNLYVVKGKAKRYPAIVAHMDTVHPIVEDLCVLQVGTLLTGFNRTKMMQTGIGGDDKVGVYIALECLRKFNSIKVVFFRDEECGCKGSAVADLIFFANCNFVLQCDRMNNCDFIIQGAGIELSNKKFQHTIWPLVCERKYQYTAGSLTDVVMLKILGITCAVANISCGYYRPHTNYEFINSDDVNNCLQLVFSLIDRFGKTHFPHELVRRTAFNFRVPIDEICDNCMNEPATRDGLCTDCYAYYNAKWNAF